MKKLTLLLILLVSVLMLNACSSKNVSDDSQYVEEDPYDEDYMLLDEELENEMLMEDFDEPYVPNPNEFGYDETCLDLGGNWIESASECEGITRDDCDTMFGTFNECASACRNDEDAQVCTMQCVFVCELTA